MQGLAHARRASSCCADSPLGRALYAVSVRRLAGLASSFLPTSPHGFALAFGSQFHTLASCRGLEPHEFTPMLGVHNRLHDILAPLELMRRGVRRSETKTLTMV